VPCFVSGQGLCHVLSTVIKYHKRNINPTKGHFPELYKRFRLYIFCKYFRRQVERIGSAEAEYIMIHSSGRTNLATIYNGRNDLDPKAIDKFKEKNRAELPDLETN